MRLLQLIILISFLGFSCNQPAQHPFSQLDEIKPNDFEDIYLYIDRNNAEIINKRLMDLNETHPFYQNDDCEAEMDLLAIAPLDNTGKKYVITYGSCPYPEFHIFKLDDYGTRYASINADKLYITGNGSIYAEGSFSSTFDFRRKFIFKDNKIEEVKQPYYAIGLKTKTLKHLNLYKTPKLYEVIASVPADYPIEVVLANQICCDDTKYLIKTDFGLMGWAKIAVGQYYAIDVEGIYLRGN